MRIVMRHEARQVPSWLIFDVRLDPHAIVAQIQTEEPRAMDDALLRSIEDEFGVTLPQDYVSFMHNYPKILDDTKCKFGPESEEAISARYFHKSFPAILEENRMIRQALPEGGQVVWPRRCFAIGSTDIGDIYVLDCDAGNSAVSLWNHEEDVFDPISDDIAGFADFIVEDVREWNAKHFPADEKTA